MLTLRTAVAGDAMAIMAVRRSQRRRDTIRERCWRPGRREPRPNRVAHVEQEIANPTFIVLVAEAASDLIGFAMACRQKTSCTPP